jgi:hypothetical protein
VRQAERRRIRAEQSTPCSEFLEQVKQEARARVLDCANAAEAEAYVRKLEGHIEQGRLLRERKGAP